jgi:hypothetical protein
VNFMKISRTIFFCQKQTACNILIWIASWCNIISLGAIFWKMIVINSCPHIYIFVLCCCCVDATSYIWELKCIISCTQYIMSGYCLLILPFITPFCLYALSLLYGAILYSYSLYYNSDWRQSYNNMSETDIANIYIYHKLYMTLLL